jgi:hypothetical protein
VGWLPFVGRKLLENAKREVAVQLARGRQMRAVVEGSGLEPSTG